MYSIVHVVATLVVLLLAILAMNLVVGGLTRPSRNARHLWVLSAVALTLASFRDEKLMLAGVAFLFAVMGHAVYTRDP